MNPYVDLNKTFYAINVIHEISTKFQLFLAHHTRSPCQPTVIPKREEDFKNLCVMSRGKDIVGLVIIDFKMAHFIFLDKSDLQVVCSVFVFLEVGSIGIINVHPFIKDTYSRQS